MRLTIQLRHTLKATVSVAFFIYGKTARKFDSNIVRNFLRQEGLFRLIRSHEPVQNGCVRYTIGGNVDGFKEIIKRQHLQEFEQLPFQIGARGENNSAPPLAGKEITHRNEMVGNATGHFLTMTYWYP